MKTKQENNKNANKKDISAAILKKVNNTIVVKNKTKKAVFLKFKRKHNAEIGNANTDMAVIPLS